MSQILKGIPLLIEVEVWAGRGAGWPGDGVTWRITCVDAGNHTPVLWKSSKCSYSLSQIFQMSFLTLKTDCVSNYGSHGTGLAGRPFSHTLYQPYSLLTL